jgi:adenylate cyclase
MVNPENHENDKAPKEIERKYLLSGTPENFWHYPSVQIVQGYIAINDDGSERRIRDASGVYTETTKSGKGMVRGETELSITAAEFERLWPLTEGKRIEKNRFSIPHDEHTIELDVYDGELWGLLVAEVEFTSEVAANDFTPPEWFGAEVTEDKRYKNQQLALHGMPAVE